MEAIEHKYTRDTVELEHKFTRKMGHASFVALLILVTFQFFVLGMITAKHHTEVVDLIKAEVHDATINP